MRTIILCTCLLLLSSIACFNKDKTSQTSSKPENVRSSDTVKVNITKNLEISWDCIGNHIITDSCTTTILKNMTTQFHSIVESIKDTTDTKNKICSKYASNLKKGDIALMFLYCLQLIDIEKDFNIKPERQNWCWIPVDMLNHLESNRIQVYQKLQSKIKNQEFLLKLKYIEENSEYFRFSFPHIDIKEK